jgi:uncharacterized membrane protein AbrB (regulator of aidB expression)
VQAPWQLFFSILQLELMGGSCVDRGVRQLAFLWFPPFIFGVLAIFFCVSFYGGVLWKYLRVPLFQRLSG